MAEELEVSEVEAAVGGERGGGLDGGPIGIGASVGTADDGCGGGGEAVVEAEG